MVRHLSSLRKMGPDHGWIHTLLEDAENERMHLLFVMYVSILLPHRFGLLIRWLVDREMLKPSFAMRMIVLGAQGVFSNFFFFAYLMSPRYCHRFVGYLEEEAVTTYAKLIHGTSEWVSCSNSEHLLIFVCRD